MSDLENYKETMLEAGFDRKRIADPLERQQMIVALREEHLVDPLARHRSFEEERQQKFVGPLEAQGKIAEARGEFLTSHDKGLVLGGSKAEKMVAKSLDDSVKARTGYSFSEISPMARSVEANSTNALMSKDIVENRQVCKRMTARKKKE